MQSMLSLHRHRHLLNPNNAANAAASDAMNLPRRRRSCHLLLDGGDDGDDDNDDEG